MHTELLSVQAGGQEWPTPGGKPEPHLRGESSNVSEPCFTDVLQVYKNLLGSTSNVAESGLELMFAKTGHNSPELVALVRMPEAVCN